MLSSVVRQKLTEQSHIEAKKQIESYRKKLDNEFKAKEQAVCLDQTCADITPFQKLGDSQQQEIKQLEEKTNKEIDTMKYRLVIPPLLSRESYNANKNQVVDLLINAIVNVDTTVPEKRKHHF